MYGMHLGRGEGGKGNGEALSGDGEALRMTEGAVYS